MTKTYRLLLLFPMIAALSACAGTVKRSENDPKPTIVQAYATLKFSSVTLDLTPEVKGKLEDNIKFSPDALNIMVKRRLENKGLMSNSAQSNLKVTITDVRVRSTFNAIMWGFMAGDDRIVGNVEVQGPGNKPVNHFEVSASYALGGFGGGQDDTRMNWLYEKFSELLVAELTGENKAASIGH